MLRARVVGLIALLLAGGCVFTSRPIIPETPDSAITFVDAPAADTPLSPPWDSGQSGEFDCRPRTLPDGGDAGFARNDGRPCDPQADGLRAGITDFDCTRDPALCLQVLTTTDGGTGEAATEGDADTTTEDGR